MRIKRDTYLDKLIDRMNNSLIKVIVGLRRSGKSYLLFNIFKEYLLSQDIDEYHIIQISLDDENYVELRNKKEMEKYIDNKINDRNTYYLLIDEIQYVKNFEPLLIKYMRRPNFDVYVTGSNSKFLSVDIDTSLNGKNDSIYMHPLSFNEFRQVYDDNNTAWNDYIMYGGLPLVANKKKNNDKQIYLINLFKELFFKDILERYKIRNPSEMQEIIKIIASSIGSYTNPANISKTIECIKKKNIKWETVERYIQNLCKSFIISEVERYDIKGRKYIGADKKYYFSDVGLRNAILNFKQKDIGHLLENVVYNELIKRDLMVNVGIVKHREKDKQNKMIDKNLEIDFIANNGNSQYAIQVATSLSDPKVLKREFKPLLLIRDIPNKIVLTLDNIPRYKTPEGIQVINVIDFLLDNNIFNN